MIYEKVQEVGNVKGILRIMDTAGSVRNIQAVPKEFVLVMFQIVTQLNVTI
jgi:hypothetical protein